MQGNEYISPDEKQFTRKTPPPIFGSEQYQRRKCQAWLKILVRNPKANQQSFLKWAAKQAQHECPDYWVTTLRPRFELKWVQNENAKTKKRAELESGKGDSPE